MNYHALTASRLCWLHFAALRRICYGAWAALWVVGRICLQRAEVARTVRRWPDEGTVMDAHDHIE